MPTNVSYEYLKAETEYHEAKSTPAKLKALRKMLSTAPGHKGAEKLQKEIKERIRKIKYKQEKESKQKKGRGQDISVKKEGAAMVCIVGFPNSGKSQLLSDLSGTEVTVAHYEYTTKEPVIRMIPFENIQFQGVEIPAIYPGFYDSKNGPQLLSITRNADFVIVLIKENKEKELKIIKEEMKHSGLHLSKKYKYDTFEQHLPHIVVIKGDWDLDKIKEKIWKMLDKIRIQTKTREKGIAKKPVILDEGANVKVLAKIVHKDFLKKFKYARIWGPSSAFDGQQVGLEHELKDKDVVEIYLK